MYFFYKISRILYFVFVLCSYNLSIMMFGWSLSILDYILISLGRIMLKGTCKRKCLHNEVMNKIDVPWYVMILPQNWLVICYIYPAAFRIKPVFVLQIRCEFEWPLCVEIKAWNCFPACKSNHPCFISRIFQLQPVSNKISIQFWILKKLLSQTKSVQIV